MNNYCYAIRCRHEVPVEHLFCQMHWYMITAKVRSKLCGAWRPAKHGIANKSDACMRLIDEARNELYELETKIKIIYSCEL